MSIRPGNPQDLPAPHPEYVQLRRGLLVARAYYFVFFVALGALGPFFNIYLSQQGLTGTQIGLLGSVPPLIALASNPFWSAIADRWQAYQRVLAICAFMAGLTSLAFIWVGGFWSTLLILCFLVFFRSPIPAILDGTVMTYVSKYDINYGTQRVTGSFGWILSSYGLGLLIGTIDISVIFWLHGLALGLAGTLLSLQLPVERSGGRVDYAAGLRTLIRLPHYRSLLLMMALFGAGVANAVNFMGLHILALGGSAALIGLANSANAVAEIPVMLLSRQWFTRFSFRKTIILTSVGFAIAWITMSQLREPWQFPIVTLLMGTCFGLGWIAMVGYANNSAPDGMRATAQAIASAAQGGLGWAIGSFAAGLLWDWGGGQAVFIAAALFVSLGATIFAAGTREKATT